MVGEEKKEGVGRGIVKEVMIGRMKKVKEVLVKGVWEMRGEELVFVRREG